MNKFSKFIFALFLLFLIVFSIYFFIQKGFVPIEKEIQMAQQEEVIPEVMPKDEEQKLIEPDSD